MRSGISEIVSLLTDYIYPRICASCDEILTEKEQHLCIKCRFTLPRTNFHKIKDSEVSKIFWGRVPAQKATSWLYFSKSDRVQRLLHNIKYKGRKEAAETAGAWCAYDLRKDGFFKGIDVIVPVPLHKNKEKTRGFNQSEWFSKGISRASKLPLSTGNFVRLKESETQTRKSRYERWANVENIFEVMEPELLQSKHILLVDDVLTTGATLEASANVLLKVPGVQVSILTLAYAAT